jgi:Protein of unknown function (DUF3352)
MRSHGVSNKEAGGMVLSFMQLGKWSMAGSLILAAASAFAFQDSPAARAVSPKHAHAASAQNSGSNSAVSAEKPDMKENGPLMAEFGRLAAKIQQGVQTPPPRMQSKVLPLLPASTSIYFSVANFGDALYQANQIFNEELHQSAELNDWWQNKAGMAGFMAEAAIEQIHQFTGYLGDEIVVAGTIKPKGGSSFAMAAEIKKPGLAAFLRQLISQYGGQSAPVRILTPQQLLTAKDGSDSKQFLVLVRPDFMVAASDVATLRSWNGRMNGGEKTFASTPFGRRLTQSYQGGVTMLLGADLQQLLALRPQDQPEMEAALRKSGLGNLKYLILDGKLGADSSSNSELSFNGPRQGIAAWLAPPADMEALEFVSPNAVTAGAVVLKSPAQMFEDIQAIADAANPMASAGIMQMQSGLGINLKTDLLAKLTGRIAFALEGATGDSPEWKVLAQVTDSNGLQNTFKQLAEAMNETAAPGKGVNLRQHTEDGLGYWSLSFFNGKKQETIDYTFAEGYLIAASSSELLKQAIETHKSRNSLARSDEFRKLVGPEHGGQASAVFFQNNAAKMNILSQLLPPDAGQLMQSVVGENKMSVMNVYGEESAIRSTGNSQSLNVMVPLVVAAVAIPNLIHAKTAANESAAAAALRTVNTAQVTYAATYPDKGFAPNLATLGSGEEDCGVVSESHACLLDAKLGCSSATCTKDGFTFSLNATCNAQGCRDYVAVATPVNSNTGDKNFCSTSDAVVRSRSGPPLNAPITAAECRRWNPL